MTMTDHAAPAAYATHARAAEGDAPGAASDVAPDMRRGADLDRLFAAADSRLAGQGAALRHLRFTSARAAIAACRAEGRAGRATGVSPDGAGAYRDDLADAIAATRDGS
jgi:hypothetical protein